MLISLSSGVKGSKWLPFGIILSRHFSSAWAKSYRDSNIRNTYEEYEKLKAQKGTSEDAYNKQRRAAESTSVLRQFRRDVTSKAAKDQQEDWNKQLSTNQSRRISEIIKNGSPEDQKEFTRQLLQRNITNSSVFRANTTKTVFEDYGSYSPYRKNKLKVEDRNLTSHQILNRPNTAERTLNYLAALPDEYAEKKHVVEAANFLSRHQRVNKDLTLEQYAAVIGVAENKNALSCEMTQYDRMIKNQRQQRNVHVFEEQLELIAPPGFEEQARHLIGIPSLSPGAVDQIYRLYLQGWSIRQISQRFGILPGRAKFCVWVRAELYDEILPKRGLSYILKMAQFEKRSVSQFSYKDYGLDLEELKGVNIPQRMETWTQNRSDASRRDPDYHWALKELAKKNAFDRDIKVEVGTKGRGNKMYLLKEWKILRGKGSDEYELRRRNFRKFLKAKKVNVKEYF